MYWLKCIQMLHKKHHFVQNLNYHFTAMEANVSKLVSIGSPVSCTKKEKKKQI